MLGNYRLQLPGFRDLITLEDRPAGGFVADTASDGVSETNENTNTRNTNTRKTNTRKKTNTNTASRGDIWGQEAREGKI